MNLEERAQCPLDWTFCYSGSKETPDLPWVGFQFLNHKG